MTSHARQTADYQPPKAVQGAMKRRYETALHWLLIAGTGALLIAAYFAGIHRGLDRYIAPFEAGQFLHAICAVATKWLTGVGNYVCLRDIQDLYSVTHGMMYDLGLREDGASWDFLFNRDFVDQALRQLFAHPHWTVPATTSGPPYLGIQGIGWGMDEGHYNFVNLAFHVFGPSMEALYRTYWLLLGISILTYILAHRRALAPLLLLLVVALVEYMTFSTSTLWFTDGVHPTTDPGNPRFLTCLCVVPTLHFITAARSPGPLHWRSIVLLGVQALVLALAMFERTTVVWVVVAVLGLTGLYWLRRRRSADSIPKRSYYPVALLVVAVATATLLDRHWTAHPGIAANGYSPGHNLWFALFYNLQSHPDWGRRYAAKYGNEHGDDLTRHACLLYLADHREEWPRWNPQSADPFNFRMTEVGMETMCRKAFFEFARNDPKFVVQVWLVYNTRAIAVYTLTFLRKYVVWLAPFSIALAGLGLICGPVISRPNRDAIVYVPLTAYLCLVAVLPNWASLVIQESLTDYFDLLAITIAMAVVSIGISIGACLSPAIASGMRKLSLPLKPPRENSKCEATC
jgi:hypothetical protein